MMLKTFKTRSEALEWDRRYWRMMKNGVITAGEFWSWRDAQDARTPNLF